MHRDAGTRRSSIETPGHFVILLGMSARFSSRLVWGAILFCAACAVQGGPLKSPKRGVNGGTVDLTPLFRWWTNHADARPLTAWVHVTGSVVGTNTYGWLVEATVESSGRQAPGEDAPSITPGGQKRILLGHPPLQDRAVFEKLAAQLKLLDDQRAQARDLQKQAQDYLRPGSKVPRPYFHKGRVSANADARMTEEAAKVQILDLDKQIKELKAKMAPWPNTDRYELDCFALDTGKQQSKLPLYDHGATWQ